MNWSLRITYAFLLAFGFYFINCIRRWIKTKSNHFSQEKASLLTIPCQIKTVHKFTNHKFNKQSRDHVLPYKLTFFKKTIVAVSRGKENRSRKVGNFTADENQDIYPYDMLAAESRK